MFSLLETSFFRLSVSAQPIKAIAAVAKMNMFFFIIVWFINSYSVLSIDSSIYVSTVDIKVAYLINVKYDFGGFDVKSVVGV